MKNLFIFVLGVLFFAGVGFVVYEKDDNLEKTDFSDIPVEKTPAKQPPLTAAQKTADKAWVKNQYLGWVETQRAALTVLSQTDLLNKAVQGDMTAKHTYDLNRARLKGCEKSFEKSVDQKAPSRRTQNIIDLTKRMCTQLGTISTNLDAALKDTTKQQQLAASVVALGPVGRAIDQAILEISQN